MRRSGPELRRAPGDVEITVPFTFARPETGAGRKAVPEFRLWGMSFEAGIPVVGRDVAPVVASWSSRSGTVLEQSARVVCRHHDGCFYVRMGKDGDRAIPADTIRKGDWAWGDYLTAGAARIFDGREYEHELPVTRTRTVNHMLSMRRNTLPPSDCGMPRRVLTRPDLLVNTLAEDLAAAKNQVHKLLIIGGELWRRVEEPRLRLSRVGPWSRVDVDFGDGVSERDYDWKLREGDEVFFRLDRMGELEAFVNDGGFGFADIPSVGDVSVAKPELLAFNPRAFAAYRVAHWVLKDCGKLVGSMNARAASLYVDLRDGCAGLSCRSGVGDVLSVFETLLPLVSRLGDGALHPENLDEIWRIAADLRDRTALRERLNAMR